MEYKVASGMKVITGHQTGQGISEFIQRALNSIPQGMAVGLLELTKELQDKFPHINKGQSYTRVGMVMNRAGNKGRFIKLTDGSDYVMITHAPSTGKGVKGEEEQITMPLDSTEEIWNEQLALPISGLRVEEEE